MPFSGHSSAPVNLGKGLMESYGRYVRSFNSNDNSYTNNFCSSSVMNKTFPITIKPGNQVNVVNLKDLGMESNSGGVVEVRIRY